jgi:hypothetical protein
MTKKEENAQKALGTYKWKEISITFEVKVHAFPYGFTKKDIEDIIKCVNNNLELGHLDYYLSTVKSSKVMSSSWK